MTPAVQWPTANAMIAKTSQKPVKFRITIDTRRARDSLSGDILEHCPRRERLPQASDRSSRSSVSVQPSR
jgi:hypothetical protein